ncbi:MAG: hypothetical protein KatS3mg119_1654 [Rhodothalassiaceae bacterium]|nr:MAG: hypothetical protein KatS3mg119_1654 [Rhodothalassiaceae bacterium]
MLAVRPKLKPVGKSWMEDNMRKRNIIALASLLAGTILSGAVAGAQEAQGQEALLERIARLEQELAALKAELHENAARVQQSEEKVAEIPTLAERIDAIDARTQATETLVYNPPLPKARWHLAGYADASLIVSDAPEGPDSFSAGMFNPSFHFQYKDIVMFESELEFSFNSEGETDLELEYTQADILLGDNNVLVIGKYLSPVGQFQERLHPSWINKSVDAPAGFGHDGLQPASDVGVQLRGVLPFGDESRLTYVFAVGNGPRMNLEGGVELEGFTSDDNDNKSLGGRIGLLPVPWLEVGASLLTADVKGLEGTVAEPDTPEPTTADFTLWGADMAITRNGWDVRFEYLNARRGAIFSALPHEEEAGAEGIGLASAGHEETAPAGDTEVTFLPRLKMEAWYAQLAYKLSGITGARYVKNLEPVVRYGEFHINGNDELREENAEKRFNIGLNYWLAPSIVARVGVEWRNFAAEERETERRFQLQFAYGF